MKHLESKQLSCVILDDDPLSIYILEDIIAQINKLKLISGFTDPIMAMAAFNEYERIDFLFIDIGMEISGLDLARMLKKKVRFVVFVTGHETLALKAFEKGDAYLVKPVNFEMVFKTIERLLFNAINKY